MSSTKNGADSLDLMSKDELLDFAKKLVEGRVSLSFYGKRTAQDIDRKVMPRIIRVNKDLSYNSNHADSKNQLFPLIKDDKLLCKNKFFQYTYNPSVLNFYKIWSA